MMQEECTAYFSDGPCGLPRRHLMHMKMEGGTWVLEGGHSYSDTPLYNCSVGVRLQPTVSQPATPDELLRLRVASRSRKKPAEIEWLNDDPDFAVLIHTNNVVGQRSVVAIGHETLRRLIEND